jgi:Do/DeqQ family serine protease
MPSHKSKLFFQAAVFLVIIGLAAWCGARWAVIQFRSEQFAPWWQPEGDNTQRPATVGTGSSIPDFVEASERSTPAVVYIKTQSTQAMRSFNDWFFGDFFNQGPQTVLNSGSGVIVSEDGYIVTNNHVVDKATKIEVVLHNKKTITAELVGSDPGSDLALLKIEASGLPLIPFANSSQVKVGEWVLAVGNPFNLTSTVTAGIVSAKGRNLHLMSNMFPIEAFIQTDAAINPGNSGGALVNTAGALIGINTAILSKTGSYNGYGFAIPSNIVHKVIGDLKEFGKVQRAFLGAEVVDLDEKICKQAGIQHMNGVFIASIHSSGGAKGAGLQSGDVITAINNESVHSKSAYDEQLSYRRPGETVELQIERDGKVLKRKVQLTNLDGDTEIQKNRSVRSTDLGCELEPLSKMELDRMQTTHGVRIVSIQAGTLSRMGLREGFVITHVNKKPMQSPMDVIDALSSTRGQVVIEGYDKNGGKSVYSFYGF